MMMINHQAPLLNCRFFVLSLFCNNNDDCPSSAPPGRMLEERDERRPGRVSPPALRRLLSVSSRQGHDARRAPPAERLALLRRSSTGVPRPPLASVASRTLLAAQALPLPRWWRAPARMRWQPPPLVRWSDAGGSSNSSSRGCHHLQSPARRWWWYERRRQIEGPDAVPTRQQHHVPNQRLRQTTRQQPARRAAQQQRR